MKQKFDELEVKLRNKEHTESSEDLKYESFKYPGKDVITSPFYDLRCFLCRREFRNTTQLGIHDRRFHLEKGRHIYNCDNCNDKFPDVKTTHNIIS